MHKCIILCATADNIMRCSPCSGRNQVERRVACLNPTNITECDVGSGQMVFYETKILYFFFTPRLPPYISQQIDRYFRWPRANAKTSIINRFVFVFLYNILYIITYVVFLLVKCFFLFSYHFGCMGNKQKTCKSSYLGKKF